MRPDSQDSAQSIFTRGFCLVTLINFVVMAIYYLLFVTSAAYVAKTFNQGLAVSGLSAGLLVIGCLLARLGGSNFVSYVGMRSTLFWGLGIYAIAIGCLIFCDTLWSVLVDRFVTGLGVGIAGTATTPIAANAVPRAKRSFGISVFSMGTALAMGLGPWIGISLTNNLEYKQMALGLFALSLLTPVMAALGHFEETRPRHGRPPLALYSYIDPRVGRFSIVVMLVFMGYGCIQAFMDPMTVARHIGKVGGLFFMICAIMTLLSRPVSGGLLDKASDNVVMLPVLGLCLISCVSLAYADTALWLLLTAALARLGFGNLQSAGLAVALAMVTPSRYPQAVTTYYVMMDVGIGAGPLIFGHLAGFYGYSGMFLGLACTLLGATLIYMLGHGRKGRRRG